MPGTDMPGTDMPGTDMPGTDIAGILKITRFVIPATERGYDAERSTDARTWATSLVSIAQAAPDFRAEHSEIPAAQRGYDEGRGQETSQTDSGGRDWKRADSPEVGAQLAQLVSGWSG